MLNQEEGERWLNRHKDGAVVNRIIDEINRAIIRGAIHLGSTLTLNELARITGSNKETLKKYLAEILSALYCFGIRLVPSGGLYADPEDDEPDVPAIVNVALRASVERCGEDFATELREGAMLGPLPGSLVRYAEGQLVITLFPGFPKIRLQLP